MKFMRKEPLVCLLFLEIQRHRQAMLAPTHIPPASGLPEIQQFTGNQFTANRGDNIDLTWHITGAVSVELQEQAIPGEFVQTIFANAPHSTTLSFPVPFYASHHMTWLLVATNAQGQSTTRSFTVDVPCPESVNFTSHCPYVDEILGLAYQPFEHGFMMWRAPTKEVGGDTRLIYIFYENGTYQAVSDTCQEGTFYELPQTNTARRFNYTPAWFWVSVS